MNGTEKHINAREITSVYGHMFSRKMRKETSLLSIIQDTNATS
jgi:hypothetical protein